MLPAAVTRKTVGASMAGLLSHLWAWLVVARGVAAENLPVAAAVAKGAAWFAIEASVPWLQMAAEFLHGLYGCLLAAVAIAVESLPGVAKSTVEYTIEASQPWLAVAAELLQGLYRWLVEAIAVVLENLPRVAKNMVEYMVEASQPWLAVAAKLLQGLYGWLVAVSTVAVEMLLEAAENAEGSVTEASQPWLAMASKLLQAHDLCGRLVKAGDKVVDSLPEFAVGATTAAMGGADDSADATTLTPMPTPGRSTHGRGGVLVYALLAVTPWRSSAAPCAPSVPCAMFRASLRRYYAAVWMARKAHCIASGICWNLVSAVVLAVAFIVYVGAKMLR